ncbi:MAG: mycofactocin system FadH/OYE family oxidoreductase 1 [Microthrixaceae bacterium]
MKLLEPLDLGARVAPNRVILGPHETNLGRRRSISERHVAYYARRAAGGAGTIVIEEASVHPSDWPYERAPLADDCAEGWARVARACQDEGAVVLAALGHAGGQGTSHWSQRELWAPSRVPEVNSREVPKWMEPEDIDAVVAGFGSAAKLAAQAGCDGVEINAGQYSLVRQFLSGLTNHRGDEWGGDRRRFLRDVLGSVRAAVGDDVVVALRLSCDELAPWAGITPEQAPDLAASVAADADLARLDLLTVVRGSIYSVAATRPDGHTPPGFNLELTRTVRDAVHAATAGRVRVAAQGSIVDVDQAEWALQEGMADAVEMTRAQISDAELVAKLRAGESGRIRPCTLSNQRSQVRDNRNPIVSALGDPYSGHETEDDPVEGHAARPLDLTVVGGGPGGLEAARVAALRGHRVTLYEASSRLGGMVRTAARGHGWERLGLLVDWLESECRLLGVELVTDHTVTVDELAARGADRAEAHHVILATGSTDGERDYDVTRAGHVVTAPRALDAPDDLPDGPVLVWDPIGGPIGVGVAELLAAAGREVHLATQDNIVGNELARSGDLAPANARLQQAGVQLHRRSLLRQVRKGRAVFEDRFTAARRELPAAVVIDAGHRLPEERMWNELRAHPSLHVVRVGDCVAPRTVHEAVLEGRRAALALG